jgi:serine/threonine protein kinase
MPPQDASLFRVEAVLWSGNTAEICRAVAPNGERVALKRIRRDKRDRANLRSLKHEADMGRRLSHPNVVRVIDYVADPRDPLLVLEFFPSRNLKVRLKTPRPDPLLLQRTEDILQQMASALAHVHQCGIIHMDIKPENFLLSDEGQVKLTDFAIAVNAKQGLSRFLGLRRIAGTRSYIAPETIRRKRPDFQTDIYSFGVTLFEVLTRRAPFTSSDPDELLSLHLTQPPPWPATYKKNLTREINDLILAMLAKNPGHRPQSMEEIAARLKRIKIYEKPPAAAQGTEA